MALDWGLIVPVVKQAEERSFLGLARAIADLAERARSKKLLPDEVSGITFTLTNSGIFGDEFGTPIINQPESAILAIGGLKKEAVVLTDAEGNDTIAIRSHAALLPGLRPPPHRRRRRAASSWPSSRRYWKAGTRKSGEGWVSSDRPMNSSWAGW